MKHTCRKTYVVFLGFLVVMLMVSLLVSSAPAQAEASGSVRGADHRTFGLGVNLGEPLGFDGRVHFLNYFSFDMVLGYGFLQNGVVIQPSLLFNLRHILDYHAARWSLVPYFGAGMKTGVVVSGGDKNQAIAAMRFPVGATFALHHGDVEISLEFAPGVEFSPEREFDASGGVGLRYYVF